MITTPIFTRLLSPAEYGQFNVFYSWLGIVGIFVSLNLSAGVYTQGLVKFEEEEKKFSSALQGLSLTLVSGWTIVYLLFREFWNSVFSLTTVQLLAMLLMIWTSAVFGFWAAAQRVHYRYRMLIFITLTVSLAKPLVGIVLVLHAQDKVTARILGLALVELVAYFGLFAVQMLRGRKFFHAKFWKHALFFNLPLIPHYLSMTVLGSADRIMIDRMTGSADAGIYSLAYSLSLIMTLFNTALMQTLSPWIYKKIKRNRIEEIAPIAYMTLFVIGGVNILLMAFAPEAVAIFAPPSYYDAVWIIPPVAMSAYFMYSYDLFAKFAFYHEKTKFIMAASMAGAVLNVILNYFFIGWFGYRAAGYTTLFCYMIYDAGHYYFMNKVCREFYGGKKPYELKKLLCMTGMFMAVGFILLFTYQHMLLRYGVIAVFLVIALLKRRELKIMLRRIMEVKKAAG